MDCSLLLAASASLPWCQSGTLFPENPGGTLQTSCLQQRRREMEQELCLRVCQTEIPAELLTRPCTSPVLSRGAAGPTRWPQAQDILVL